MRWMLFFDSQSQAGLARRAREHLSNVKPKKSNSPSGTVQIRVLSSFNVSFSLPKISRRRCSAASALEIAILKSQFGSIL